MSNQQDRNRNARISSRVDRTGKFRTETRHRDGDSVRMAVSTNSSNATRLFIDFPESVGSVNLSGREARSLYRLLHKHYSNLSKV